MAFPESGSGFLYPASEPTAHGPNNYSCMETGMRGAQRERRRTRLFLTPRRLLVEVQRVLLFPRQPLRHAEHYDLESTAVCND